MPGREVLQELLLTLLARNATAVMTNVPGPQQPLYLAGATIDSLMFWVPQSGDIGMGVSIISYNGACSSGSSPTARCARIPSTSSRASSAEFEKLVLTTLMAPWPRDGDLDAAAAERAVAGRAGS